MKWEIPVFPTVAALIMTVSGCSQSGPSDSELKNSLQSKLPAYWEVTSLSLENKENLGSKSDPNVQARFKAVIRLKEDTFKSEADQASTVSWFSQPKTTNVTFVSQVERKGKTAELFGVSHSKRFTDSWKTEFRFDNEPTSELGQPRSFFKGKTVLRNSKEEDAYKAELAKQEADKLAQLSGTWEGTYRCGFDGPTGLKLVIDAKSNNQVNAVFNFFPIPNGRSILPGSFNMEGAYQASTSGSTSSQTSDGVRLTATSWIKRPQNYTTVDLEGKVNLTQGTLNGEIPNTGCGDVKLAKKQ
jgi:hypothetical protein